MGGTRTPCRLWITEHAGGTRLEVLAGMRRADREDLLDMLELGLGEDPRRDRSAIVVCHAAAGVKKRLR